MYLAHNSITVEDNVTVAGPTTLKAGNNIHLKPGFTAPSGIDFTAKIGTVTNVAKRFYYLKDHLGSIRVVVNEAGEIVSSDDYDPWGMILTGRNTDGSYLNAKYKFTGKERDVETGYDYFGARYYDSRIGRWLQVDLLADKTPFINPYHYTKNNPINRIDPNGKEDFTVTVRTYIPFQRVGPFWGDNRGPRLSGGTYRTEQKIRVETNPNIRVSPLISKSENTGVTIMDTPKGIIIDKGEGKFSTTVTRNNVNSGDNAIINVSGSAANPLVPFAPSIDYNLSILLIPGENGQDNISILGTHDGFPAYEVWIESEGQEPILIHNYSPENSTTDVLRLFPPEDKEVKNEVK